MKLRKARLAGLISLALLGSYGCASTTDEASEGAADAAAEKAEDTGGALPEFESDAILSLASLDHASASIVSGQGVTKGDKALRLDFEAVSEANKFNYWPHIKLRPEGGFWNWNANGSLTLDMTNPTDSPVNVILKLVDNVGAMGAGTNQINYAVSIAPGATENVEMLFNGTQRALAGYWGGEKLNLRNLVEFQVFVQGPADEQSVIIDNFGLVAATGDFVAADAGEVVVEGPVPGLLDITHFEKGEARVLSDRSSAPNKFVKHGDSRSIEAVFPEGTQWPNLTFMADQPWDWSEVGDFNLAVDMANIGDQPVQLFVRIDDAENQNFGGVANGVEHSISAYVTLAPGDDGTYYIALKQLSDQLVSGMRSEPPKKAYNAQAISYGWGETELDVSNIVSMQLYMEKGNDAKIRVDSLRLIPNIDADTSRYEGIMDEFGQFTGYDWPEKILDEAQLQQDGKEALAHIGNPQPLADRSKFGGWAEGPRYDATGFFRVEKIDGKWAMIDPEGYLFFATGLDNVRMDDTVTVTGIDFADPDTRGGQEVASPLRNAMFEWLPEYDEELAANYDYASYMHSGALPKGEVFSFYRANLMRKYDTDLESALDIWEEVTLDRMVDWGFTTLGNWSDPRFYQNERVAYEAHGWIMGDHARISTGNDYWGPIHDPFDPEFVTSTRNMAESVASEVKGPNDPWLMGIFVDNEMSWGNTLNEANHYGLIVNALSYDAATSPAKAAFSMVLKEKYGDISALSSAWGVEVASWDAFDKSFDHRSRLSSAMKKDYSELMQMLSEKYFSTVQAELKRVLPNHLYLGARFADWGVTPEIARGAAPYVDVMSYNLYADTLTGKGDWSRLPELDKPSIIGEFHFGSTDTGLFHGGIVAAADQKDRARKYREYMESVIENPYFIGAHWFQYLDSPATGRAWDGENYNIGFVTIGDVPYEALVEEAKQVNQELYQLRYGK
ncbi:hypothetical protein [Aliagarivorans marinus]|uniref:hypothetical protein n=1 Tax=Aliagarivorans marinus TaxID=561965 RepID=UPI0003FF513E|nr:hypothetical protein [Aliagarivorans marinus]